jgi:hypothetical protein
MKYLKHYEKLKRLRIGDYVICQEPYGEQNLDDFLAQNVGQYNDKFDSDEFPYDIKYFDIPTNILEMYFSGGYDNNDGTRQFSSDQIIDSSSSKQKLELKLLANKYNL